MRAAGKDEAITGLWFEGQKYYPDTNGWVEAKEYAVFETLKIWLEGYFTGKKREHNILLSPEGTAFQVKVWNILRQIWYAKNITYGEIAKLLAHDMKLPKMSAQAVGGAVGHNPISILIPCHRVVGANGSLTGYAGGIDKKQFLLELENKNMQNGNG
jgi:methylated-DNA-[protein]-cysteine S-methyltransferase